MFSSLLRPSTFLDINLLPKDPFTDSGVGRFLNWALSVGRYIVVFTEMIVILTFLSRFTLDRQLTDLNESILKKQALLESYASLEDKARHVQEKAEFIETLNTTTNLVANLDYLIDKLPSDLVFDNLEVRQDRFIIVGRSYSQTSLSNFINELKRNSQYEEVSIDQIRSSEEDTTISFIVRTKYPIGTNTNPDVEVSN